MLFRLHIWVCYWLYLRQNKKQSMIELIIDDKETMLDVIYYAIVDIRSNNKEGVLIILNKKIKYYLLCLNKNPYSFGMNGHMQIYADGKLTLFGINVISTNDIDENKVLIA